MFPRPRTRPRPSPDPLLPIVSASAIGDWGWCSVRYQLGTVERRRPTDVEATRSKQDRGTAFHERRDRELRSAEHVSRLARTLLLLGAAGLVLMLLLSFAACAASEVEAASSWTGALSAGFIMLALALARLSVLNRDRAAVPRGIRLIASDMGANRTRTLRDAHNALVARPDWVFRKRFGLRMKLVCAELKSRPAPRAPFHGHVLQTATGIMVLLAEHGRRAASTGYLIYQDRHLPVVLTDALRAEVLHTAAEVRQIDAGIPARRNHASPRRCAVCPFSDQCPQSLAR